MQPAHNMPFTFKCATCNDIHEGMLSFGAREPLSCFTVERVAELYSLMMHADE